MRKTLTILAMAGLLLAGMAAPAQAAPAKSQSWHKLCHRVPDRFTTMPVLPKICYSRPSMRSWGAGR